MKDIRGTWRSPLAQPFGPVTAVQRGTFVQSGTLSGISINAGLTNSTSVTFPARFGSVPKVYCSISSVAHTLNITVAGIGATKTAFDLNYSNNSAATNETALSVDWFAVGTIP